jgi:hypothetical protein
MALMCWRLPATVLSSTRIDTEERMHRGSAMRFMVVGTELLLPHHTERISRIKQPMIRRGRLKNENLQIPFLPALHFQFYIAVKLAAHVNTARATHQWS